VLNELWRQRVPCPTAFTLHQQVRTAHSSPASQGQAPESNLRGCPISRRSPRRSLQLARAERRDDIRWRRSERRSCYWRPCNGGHRGLSRSILFAQLPVSPPWGNRPTSTFHLAMLSFWKGAPPSRACQVPCGHTFAALPPSPIPKQPPPKPPEFPACVPGRTPERPYASLLEAKVPSLGRPGHPVTTRFSLFARKRPFLLAPVIVKMDPIRRAPSGPHRAYSSSFRVPAAAVPSGLPRSSPPPF